MSIEENNGAESLVLSGGCDVASNRQVLQKGLNACSAEFALPSANVEARVAPNSVNVEAFRRKRVPTRSDRATCSFLDLAERRHDRSMLRCS